VLGPTTPRSRAQHRKLNLRSGCIGTAGTADDAQANADAGKQDGDKIPCPRRPGKAASPLSIPRAGSPSTGGPAETMSLERSSPPRPQPCRQTHWVEGSSWLGKRNGASNRSRPGVHRTQRLWASGKLSRTEQGTSHFTLARTATGRTAGTPGAGGSSSGTCVSPDVESPFKTWLVPGSSLSNRPRPVGTDRARNPSAARYRRGQALNPASSTGKPHAR